MKFATAIPEIIEDMVCDKHGAYTPKFEPWVTKDKFMVMENCPICATEDRERQEREDAEELVAISERRIINEKTRAGLNKRHIGCRFSNFIANTTPKALALSKTQSYADGILAGGGNCLVMAGKVGTGKTHLAAAMVNKMIEKGKTCQLIKMSELIRSLKATWSRNSDQSESELISAYSKVSLLIVDEIGIQFGSDTEKLLLSEIIDNRYQDVLPTVLISNLDTDGIRDCIGERSYDRLRQDGGKIVAFDWDSERSNV